MLYILFKLLLLLGLSRSYVRANCTLWYKAFIYSTPCIPPEEREIETPEGCFPETLVANKKVCESNGTTCEQLEFEANKQTFSCFDGYQEHYVKLQKESTASRQLCFTVNTSIDSKESSANLGFMVYRILQPIIVVAGLVGNALSFLVMSSKEIHQYSFSCYLMLLSIVDSLVLLHYAMDWLDIISTSFRVFKFRYSSYPACLVYPYLIRVCQLSSAWFVVGFTVDRSVSVCYPFFARKHLSCYRAKLITGIIVIATFLTQIYHPIFLSKDTASCWEAFAFPNDLSAEKFGAYEVLLVLSRTIFLLILPFALICISNLGVVVAVKRNTNQTWRCEGDTSRDNAAAHRKKNAERKMSLKLMSVSVMFFLLLLPDAIMVNIDFTNIVNGYGGWYSVGKGYRLFTKLIFTVNFAINYVLYGLAFRKHVRLLFSRCQKKADALSGSDKTTRVP